MTSQGNGFQDMSAAVDTIRREHSRAVDGAFGLTSKACIACLSSKPDRVTRLKLSGLKKLVGDFADDEFLTLLRQRTPPATVAAFFHFYVLCARSFTRRDAKRLLEIATEKRELLGDHIAWSTDNAEGCISQAALKMKDWLMAACGSNDKSPVAWRAPSYLLMKPLGERDYDNESLRKDLKKSDTDNLVAAFTRAYLRNCRVAVQEVSDAAVVARAISPSQERPSTMKTADDHKDTKKNSKREDGKLKSAARDAAIRREGKSLMAAGSTLREAAKTITASRQDLAESTIQGIISRIDKN